LPSTTLSQLSKETTLLYAAVRPSVVRVQMPIPQWVRQFSQNQNPQNQNSQFVPRLINPDLLRQLQSQMAQSPGGGFILVRQVTPTTAPVQQNADPSSPANTPPSGSPRSGAEQPAGSVQSPPSDPDADRPSPANEDLGADGGLLPESALAPAPNDLGIILDSQGNLMVPLYVDRRDVANHPIPVVMADGSSSLADFVGSDRLTNISVLRLRHYADSPAPIAEARPDEGALVLLLPMQIENARLAVWTGGSEDFSVVALTDGTIAGFAVTGHFLKAAAFAPLARQIIQTGRVAHRSVMGVAPAPLASDDPVRRWPALGTKPAIRVLHVSENSPAALAGIQVNDILLSVAGEPTGNVPMFAAAVANARGPTDVQLLRDGGVITLSLDLQPR
jgi:hypothetical protein